MKAVTLLQHRLDVVDLPDPEPGPGQLVIDVQRCGICGSDLHTADLGDDMADTLDLVGYHRYVRADQQAVLGHEFYGTVAAHGPRTRGTLEVGTPVVAVPLVRRGREVDGIGLSTAAPGGYAEKMVVQEALTLRVPDGLDPDLAVLTEPMAVAWHAVARSEVNKRDVAVVLGCGPVGLAVITILKSRGVRTVVASDPSPGRRALAERCGADVVLDPRQDSPYDATPRVKHVRSLPAAYNLALDVIEGSVKARVPWWHTWRLLDRVGLSDPKAPVVFECVGNPGMIDGALAGVPLFSRVVVVGVCMGADTFRPSLAINKEIDLRFVLAYTPLEFRDTLQALADGRIDASPLLTGRVGLGGVATAFEALRDPERHAKILIDPALPGTEVHDI